MTEKIDLLPNKNVIKVSINFYWKRYIVIDITRKIDIEVEYIHMINAWSMFSLMWGIENPTEHPLGLLILVISTFECGY